MKKDNGDKLRERVRQIAENALNASGSVGPLQVLMGLNWLYAGHVEQWQRGNEQYRILEQHFQSTPSKRARVFQFFVEWANEQGLQPIEANYVARSVRGSQPLQVTATGDVESERFFRTQFARPDMSEKQTEKLQEKLNKAPEIVVFMVVGKSRPCSECGIELAAGMCSVVEKSQPLCLECADLDHLMYLPAGDATLTRRAKKLSPLSAVVVRYSRSRNRYERQGILVTEKALAQAEAQCDADAPLRAARREQAAALRATADQRFVADVLAAILKQFPRCALDEARRIAMHTAERGSGRVGRSAAGRELDARAIELAVVAYIRHEHTEYDTMLMRGIERTEARQLVQGDIERQLDAWKG